MKNRYLIIGATVLSVAWFAAGATTMYFTGTQLLLQQYSNAEKLTSYSQGFQAGENSASQKYTKYYNQGYNSGYQIAKEKYSGNIMYKSDQRVTGVGSFNYSGYTFYIQDNVTVGGTDYAGFSFPSNSTVLLENDRLPSRFMVMCNHELLHQLFPSYDHAPGNLKYDDAIYYLEDKVELEICEFVTWKSQKLNRTVSS